MLTQEIIRVVTEVEDGCVAYADNPGRALAKGIKPDVVLVRHDGWTLGCRYEDWHAAYATWAGEWASYVDLDSGKSYWIS